jgi:hypothetical protein
LSQQQQNNNSDASVSVSLHALFEKLGNTLLIHMKDLVSSFVHTNLLKFKVT